MPQREMSTEKNILEILELMRRDDSIDAPAGSIRWASNLFRTLTNDKPSLVKRLVAALQMEIAPNKPAFGERSASASQVRQLLFKAGDNAIDLRIEPHQKGSSIRGQVLGEGFAGAKVRLFSDDRSNDTSANEMSEFSFDNVPAGEYELVIRGGELEINLKSIEIES